jgi:pimeloyl-ACP methyl ester carboxylesterase
MRTRTELHNAGQRSDTLLVLLPPALASIDDLDEQGFVAALRQRQLPVDLRLVDVTAQRVIDKTLVDALHENVLLPARAEGYRAVWLAGISMGAFSALYYVAHHAEQVAGVFLMAPYPGTADVLTEIRAAGGPLAWCQSPGSVLDERRWWQWLGQQALQGQWPTPVYFGTGNADRFFSGQQLLADVLPEERVRMIPGKHQWPTWQALWADWLDHGPLTGRALDDPHEHAPSQT